MNKLAIAIIGAIALCLFGTAIAAVEETRVEDCGYQINISGAIELKTYSIETGLAGNQYVIVNSLTIESPDSTGTSYQVKDKQFSFLNNESAVLRDEFGNLISLPMIPSNITLTTYLYPCPDA